MLKLSMIRHIHSRMEATFSFRFDFSDVYSRWKLRIQFWILVWHIYKQFNNDINITWTKTNLSNGYSVALLHKISLISPHFDLAAIL